MNNKKTLNLALAFAAGAASGAAAFVIFLYFFDERYFFVRKIALWIPSIALVASGFAGVILEFFGWRMPVAVFFRGNAARKAVLLTAALLAPAVFFPANLGIQADLYGRHKQKAEKIALDISSGIKTGSGAISVSNTAEADYAVIAEAYSLRAEELVLAGFPCRALARKIEVINSANDGRYIYLVKGCGLIGREALSASTLVRDEKGNAFVAGKTGAQIRVYTRKDSEGRTAIYRID
jgi:MFS family permease